MDGLGRFTEEDMIDCNVREIEDFIADCFAKNCDYDVIPEKLFEYIMEYYLEKPEDISDGDKIRCNKAFIVMIVAISKVDEDIFRDVLRHALSIYNVPLSIFLLEAIEKVYWSENILAIFDKICYSDYSIGLTFNMLHKATKSPLTSTKKMVHDIFMKNAGLCFSHNEFSAQLENIKLLAETGQISQAMKEYRSLTDRYA
jgi:hypothetical protein